MNKQEQQIASNKIIQEHIIQSMAMGVIPVPGIDLIAVSISQMQMLKKLCLLFDRPFDRIGSESLLCSIGGATIARTGASIFKVIPFVGSGLGGFSVAIFSGATTYALGQMYLNFLEDDKSIDTVDADEANSLFRHFYNQFINLRKKQS